MSSQVLHDPPQIQFHREDLGIIVDALIREKDWRVARKSVNPASSSDETVRSIDRLIRAIGSACDLQPGVVS